MLDQLSAIKIALLDLVAQIQELEHRQAQADNPDDYLSDEDYEAMLADYIED